MITGIFNIGLGNIASIQRMVERVGGKSVLIAKPQELDAVKKVIIPGVGHFDEGMKRLKSTGLADALTDRASDGSLVVLGICLGMQLLCRDSEEGLARGLGLVDANVCKFDFPAGQRLKVPHMGWNRVKTTISNQLLLDEFEEQRFYFVHSYKVVPDHPSIVIGVASYGSEFCAAFQVRNIFGIQFHPEKSHRFGMSIMRRFIEI